MISFNRDCGGMGAQECDGAEQVIYAWAKDAPAKNLPKGHSCLYNTFIFNLNLCQKPSLVCVLHLIAFILRSI